MALILVVDDDRTNLKLAVTALESAGYDVACVEGGEAAVRLSRQHAPDLILMDVQMPGQDGITSLRRLRADARTRDIPVVAFTAMAMKGDAERLLADGFSAYVAKPVRYRDLLAAVADLMARAAATSTVPPDASGQPIPC